jgi:cell shape-determining protein MreC
VSDFAFSARVGSFVIVSCFFVFILPLYYLSAVFFEQEEQAAALARHEAVVDDLINKHHLLTEQRAKEFADECNALKKQLDELKSLLVEREQVDEERKKEIESLKRRLTVQNEMMVASLASKTQAIQDLSRQCSEHITEKGMHAMDVICVVKHDITPHNVCKSVVELIIFEHVWMS